VHLLLREGSVRAALAPDSRAREPSLCQAWLGRQLCCRGQHCCSPVQAGRAIEALLQGAALLQHIAQAQVDSKLCRRGQHCCSILQGTGWLS